MDGLMDGWVMMMLFPNPYWSSFPLVCKDQVPDHKEGFNFFYLNTSRQKR